MVTAAATSEPLLLCRFHISVFVMLVETYLKNALVDIYWFLLLQSA